MSSSLAFFDAHHDRIDFLCSAASSISLRLSSIVACLSVATVTCTSAAPVIPPHAQHIDQPHISFNQFASFFATPGFATHIVGDDTGSSRRDIGFAELQQLVRIVSPDARFFPNVRRLDSDDLHTLVQDSSTTSRLICPFYTYKSHVTRLFYAPWFFSQSAVEVEAEAAKCSCSHSFLPLSMYLHYHVHVVFVETSQPASFFVNLSGAFVRKEMESALATLIPSFHVLSIDNTDRLVFSPCRRCFYACPRSCFPSRRSVSTFPSSDKIALIPPPLYIF